MGPKVTVGIPVHNGEQFLAEAVESVLGQTFRDLELIISDNASTDRTEAIAIEYVNSDPRVVYVRSPQNRGAAWNYNHMLDLARGDYFKWQAHDDLIDRNYIAKSVEVLDRDPGVVLVYGRTRLIDAHGRPVAEIEDDMHLNDPSPRRRLARLLDRANMCNPVTGLVKTEVLRRTRRIDSFRGSDYVLLAELSMLGRIHELPERMFLRRIHPASSQRANKTEQELQQWLDPSARGNSRFPNVRLTLELLKSAWRMPLSGAERLACMFAIYNWPKARLRDTLGRYKMRIKGILAASE